MKTTTKIACLSMAAFMAACVPAGYYDSNGVYRAYGKSDSYRYNKPMAGTGPESDATVVAAPASTTTIVYTQPGYYDQNGNYVATVPGPAVPTGYFPPRGLCRIWFTDRPADAEPQVETCAGIQSRVPAGAYVIYGG